MWAIRKNLEKKNAPAKNYTLKQVRTFDDNVMLINPAIDASDKELHARNGFKTASKNLV